VNSLQFTIPPVSIVRLLSGLLVHGIEY